VFHFEKPCGKAKGASRSGLTKKSFRKEISILAKGRPRKEILEMFAVVIQQEHKKMSAKNTKKAKNTIILDDESSDSENENMSVDQMSISKTDNEDSPSEKITDKTDENRTYHSRIEKLGAIPNDE
jgi:restriction endonuclease Mrr